MQPTCVSFLGPIVKRSAIIVLFTFKKGPKEIETNPYFKSEKDILIPRAVGTVYLKNQGDQLPAQAVHEQW